MGNIKFAGFWGAIHGVREDLWDYETLTGEREIEVDIEIAYAPNTQRQFLQLEPRHGTTAQPVHLPTEVILGILEEACITPTLRPDTQLLLAASMVCKSWSAPAQALLFRNVMLRSEQAFAAFISATSPATSRGLALAGCVRSLHAIMDHAQPSGLRPYSLARAVALCPDLQEVDISCFGAPSPLASASHPTDANNNAFFDQKSLALLRAGPSITTLRFANWSSDAETLPQLLSIYPRIRNLSLRGASNPLSTRPSPSSPLPKTLQDLNLIIQPPLVPELLDWLTQSLSEPRLHSLEFTRQPTPELLEKILAVHGPTLISLALPSLFAGGRDLVRSLCPNLAVLRVEHPWMSPSVFKDVCREWQLRHIAFGADAETPLGPVIEFVKAQQVEKVLMMLWTRRPIERGSHPQLDDLMQVCADRGVEFRVEWDVRVFRAVGASAAFLQL